MLKNIEKIKELFYLNLKFIIIIENLKWKKIKYLMVVKI